MTDAEFEIIRARLNETKRLKTRNRIATMLARKRQREEHDRIPTSRRRWDPMKVRWTED
jgi:hypothetical protein